MDNFELPEPIDGPDKEANEAKLQEELQSYHEACRQEFEVGVKYGEGTLTPSEIRTKTKELLVQAIPMAVARMKYLCVHGQSEGVQIKAAQYIIDRGLGKEAGGLVGDPLEELLKGLENSR